MYLVVFEVEIKNNLIKDYLSHAQALLPVLDETPGLLSVERFNSLKHAQKLLSLSFWEEPDSIALWRNNSAHRLAQLSGRNDIFSDYRISVAHIDRQYTFRARKNAPDDSNRYFSIPIV